MHAIFRSTASYSMFTAVQFKTLYHACIASNMSQKRKPTSYTIEQKYKVFTLLDKGEKASKIAKQYGILRTISQHGINQRIGRL